MSLYYASVCFCTLKFFSLILHLFLKLRGWQPCTNKLWLCRYVNFTCQILFKKWLKHFCQLRAGKKSLPSWGGGASILVCLKCYSSLLLIPQNRTMHRVHMDTFVQEPKEMSATAVFLWSCGKIQKQMKAILQCPKLCTHCRYTKEVLTS